MRILIVTLCVFILSCSKTEDFEQSHNLIAGLWIEDEIVFWENCFLSCQKIKISFHSNSFVFYSDYYSDYTGEDCPELVSHYGKGKYRLTHDSLFIDGFYTDSLYQKILVPACHSTNVLRHNFSYSLNNDTLFFKSRKLF
jgi:hypothetical protein